MPHGLSNGQSVFITLYAGGGTTIDGERIVTTIGQTATSFTIPVDTTGGTSGSAVLWVPRAANLTGAYLTAGIPDATTNTMSLNSLANIVPGQMLLVDGEAMYVSSVSPSFVVTRGANRTLATPHPDYPTAVFAYSGSQLSWAWNNLAVAQAQSRPAGSAWFMSGISGVTLRDLTITSHGRTGTHSSATPGPSDQTGWALVDILNCQDVLLDNVEAMTSGNLGIINEGTGSSGVHFRNVRVHDTIKDGLAAAWDGASVADCINCEVWDAGDDGISVNAVYLPPIPPSETPPPPNPPQRVTLQGCRVHDSKSGLAWVGSGIGIIAQFVTVTACEIYNVNTDGIVIYDWFTTNPQIATTAHHINLTNNIIRGTGNGGQFGNGILALGCRELLIRGNQTEQHLGPRHELLDGAVGLRQEHPDRRQHPRQRRNRSEP